MEVIIYVRFSSYGQKEGHSVERQLQDCTAYAMAKGWPIGEIIKDEARSAYTGKHRADTSAFGRFERAAMLGEHAGRVLLIERLDRFSRQDYQEVYDLLRAFMKVGVSVATVEGDRLYPAHGTIDFIEVIELLLRLKMNNEESSKKASHGNAKWEARRVAMEGGKPATALCPAWLRLSEDRSGYIIVGADTADDRGEIVRRIFALTDQGLGAERVARTLNKDGIKPWPRFANREPRFWSRKTISLILANPAVIGDHQPKKRGGDGRFAAVGDPIRGFYPRVIETDLFQRVNASAADRKAVRGNKSRQVSNLVSGLAICSQCGGKMNYTTGRPAGWVRIKDGVAQAPAKSPSASLRCSAAVAGTCDNTRFYPYISLEKALIQSALHLALDDATFAKRGEMAKLNVLIADRERDRQIAYDAAVTLWDLAGESKIARERAMAREEEVAAIDVHIAELKAARVKAAGQASATEQMSRLNEIRDKLEDADLDERVKHRLKVAAGFRSIIVNIECREGGDYLVKMVEGLRVLRIVPSRGRREPEVWDFDLHHPDRGWSSQNQRAARYIERKARVEK